MTDDILTLSEEKKRGKILTKSEEHCDVRASFRYNRELSRQDLNNIISMIQTGNSLPVCKGNKGKTTVHYVIYKKIPHKLVYNFKHKEIVTFLPLDVDEYNRIKEEDNNKRIESAIKFLNKNGYVVDKK